VDKRGPGLWDVWPKVIHTLDSIVNIYDNLNKTISLNLDKKLRAEAIRGKITPDARVLDAGAGNGVFTSILLQEQPNVRDVVMLDILPSMLKNTTLTGDSSHIDKVVAVFENMPFREHVFNIVIMGFSIRDAYNMRRALEEVGRILHSDGNLLILDLGKPSNPLLRAGVTIYWRVIAPLIALIKIGRRGLTALAIYPTYKRFPSNRDFKKLLNDFFEGVKLTEKMLGSVIIACCEKPTSKAYKRP